MNIVYSWPLFFNSVCLVMCASGCFAALLKYESFVLFVLGGVFVFLIIFAVSDSVFPTRFVVSRWDS